MNLNELVNAYGVAKKSIFRLSDEEADRWMEEIEKFNSGKAGKQ